MYRGKVIDYCGSQSRQHIYIYKTLQMLSDSEKHFNELVNSPLPQDKAPKYLQAIYY